MKENLKLKDQHTILNFKPYPEYKPSEVNWLDRLPEHWELNKLKYLANIEYSNVDKHKNDDETQVKLCNYTDVYYENEITNAIDFMQATATADEITKYTLKKGDVLITKDSETPDDIAVPAYVAEGFNNVICGYHLGIIRPLQDKSIGKYLMRSFQTIAISEQMGILAKGITRYGLGKSDLENSIFISPPLYEQLAIINFLDRETGRIDRLIEKQERLVELLEEKRTALISHAVTKGLDPDVEMKNSGVEWLGKIPKHWQTIKLKYISTINDESLNEKTDPDLEIDYVDIGSVDKIYGIVEKERMKFNKAPSRARRIVKKGDVIVSTVRTYLKAIAPIEDINDNLIVSTGFAVVRPRDRINSKFASYALRASYFVDSVVAKSVGVSYPAINTSVLGALPLAIPPLVDQEKIGAHIEREIRKVDNLVEKINDSIEKLREYRTSLISAAVTGKIDVRDHV